MKILHKIKRIFARENTSGIRYIHHQPTLGNIGDTLCSPKHYFSFESPIKELTIIGGGVFVNYAMKTVKKNKLDISKTILWGTGLSIRPSKEKPSLLQSLDYLAWGIRDKDMLTDDEHYLPCVSCLHSMIDDSHQTEISTEDSTLLFINADPKVTSSEHIAAIKNICQENNWYFLLNNCSENDISIALKSHQKVITNSYHGTYWGLLSGKDVISIGYSSKFKSLLRSMNFDAEALVPVDRGSGDSLVNCLAGIAQRQHYIKLEDHKKMLASCRQKNINFADNLVHKQVVSSYKLKHKLT